MCCSRQWNSDPVTDPALWLLLSLMAPSLLWLSHFKRERLRRGPHMLLYHRLVEDSAPRKGSESLFSISATTFASHLDALLAQGYSFVSMETYNQWRQGTAELPPNPLLICFDDGCVSVHSLAFPILKNRDIPATVFVTTREDAFVFHLPSNPQRRLSGQELQALHAQGWTLGVHGTDHSPPSKMSESQLLADFEESIQTLEELSGVRALDYAIPGNFDSQALSAVANQAGMERVWTARPGVLEKTTPDHALPRINVEGTSTPEQLIASLQPAGRVNRRWISGCKRLPATLLGPKLWLPIRRWIFQTPLGSHLTVPFWTRLGAALLVALLITTALIVWP